MLCSGGKTSCRFDVTSCKFKVSSKDINKRVKVQSGDGPLENYWRMLAQNVIMRPKNVFFRTNTPTVAAYDPLKKATYSSFLKRIVGSDAIHTQLLNFSRRKQFFSFLSSVCSFQKSEYFFKFLKTFSLQSFRSQQYLQAS